MQKKTYLDLEKIKILQNELKQAVGVWKVGNTESDKDFNAVDLTNYKTTLNSLEAYAKQVGGKIDEDLKIGIENAANNKDLETLQEKFRLVLSDIND